MEVRYLPSGRLVINGNHCERSDMSEGRSVGIVGSGPVGRGLATLWARAGYEVVVGTRTPATTWADRPDGIRLAAPAEAAGLPRVVLAVPHAAAEAVARDLAPLLRDTMVIDPMNAVTVRDGRVASALPDGVTEGQWLSRLLPGALVVRAFSHLQAELLPTRSGQAPGMWGVGYALDELSARPAVERFLADTGYAPVFAGRLADAAVLDPGGVAFPHLFPRTDLERLVTAHRLPELWERFNSASLAEVLHEDVRWSFPFGDPLDGPGFGTLVGRAAVAAHLERAHAAGVRLGGVSVELPSPAGAVVHATGVLPRPAGPVSVPVVGLVAVRDGLIGEVREYWDTAAVTAGG